MRLSVEEARALGLDVPGKKPSKYKNEPAFVDGYRFPSKKQAKRYAELVVLARAGEVLFFLQEVPIYINPKRRYRVDFVVFWSDGTYTFEDVKGYKTQVYQLKKDLIEGKYPIKIQEI